MFATQYVYSSLGFLHYVHTQLAFQHVSSAARTAKMVQNVTEVEVENTEDPQFKAELIAAKDRVTQCMTCVYTCTCLHKLYM